MCGVPFQENWQNGEAGNERPLVIVMMIKMKMIKKIMRRMI